MIRTIEEVTKNENVDFTGIPPSYYLLGLILTDSCRRFCEKNNEMSINIMEKMFDGIPEKDIVTTIQTITKIESNLKSLIY